jgi:TPR repeat protein
MSSTVSESLLASNLMMMILVCTVEGLTLASAYSAYYGINRPKNFKDALLKLGELSILHPYSHSHGVMVIGYLAEKENNADAMILLADSYLDGIGHLYIHGKYQEKNYRLAKQWLERAVDADHPLARAKLGHLLVQEAKASAKHPNDNVNELLYQKGRDLLIQAAMLGIVEAETSLGIISYEACDYVQAHEWFERAIAHGSPKAMNYAGLLYLYGDGVIRQPELAYQHFITAASSGDQEACYQVAQCLERGLGTEKNHNDAMVMYHIGSIRGNAQAMYSLGILLVKKAIAMYDAIKPYLDQPSISLSVEKNSYLKHIQEKDLMVLRTLIDHGIVGLGKYDEIDHDQIPSYSIIMDRGIYWMRRAAEGNVLEASFQLGQIYEQGLAGVAIDLYSAYHQYLYTTKHSNPLHVRAALCVAHMAYAGVGVTQDYQLAAKYYEMAALTGQVDAMNALAILLEEGQSTEYHIPNIDQAATWYLEASKLGSEQAAVNLAYLLKTHSSKIAFVSSRSGAALSVHEVFQFLIKQYPSCKSLFERQQTERLDQLDVPNMHDRVPRSNRYGSAIDDAVSDSGFDVSADANIGMIRRAPQ